MRKELTKECLDERKERRNAKKEWIEEGWMDGRKERRKNVLEERKEKGGKEERRKNE